MVMVMNLYSTFSFDIFKCALQASDLWVRLDISMYASKCSVFSLEDKPSPALGEGKKRDPVNKVGSAPASNRQILVSIFLFNENRTKAVLKPLRGCPLTSKILLCSLRERET